MDRILPFNISASAGESWLTLLSGWTLSTAFNAVTLAALVSAPLAAGIWVWHAMS